MEPHQTKQEEHQENEHQHPEDPAKRGKQRSKRHRSLNNLLILTKPRAEAKGRAARRYQSLAKINVKAKATEMNPN